MRTPVAIESRDMFRDESLQRFIEGLKLAASCAKEMNALAPKQGWGKVSEQLNYMIASGYKLARARPMSRGDLLLGVDEIAKTQNINVAG